MKNSHNITIVILLISAAVLGAMLISTYQVDSTAYADIGLKGGGYIMGTMAWTGSRDLIYIIDLPTRRMNVYFPDDVKHVIEMLPDSGLDLERAFSDNR